MNKRWIMILMALLLAGCNLPRPAAVSPGNVPVVPTSTTEGVVPPNNPPPADAATDTPTATFTPSPTASITVNAAVTQEGASFISVTKSTDKIHWGACMESEVTLTVTVSDPRVWSVVLFFRIKDKATGAHPDWTPVAMNSLGNGVFSYVVKAVDVPSHALYADGWLQYQFVSTDRQAHNLDRTDPNKYAQDITITGTCP